MAAALGDEAGLFGRGTSGEGTDAANLRIPGVELLESVLEKGRPKKLTVHELIVLKQHLAGVGR